MDQEHRIAALERELDLVAERLDATRIALAAVLAMVERLQPPHPRVAGQFMEPVR